MIARKTFFFLRHGKTDYHPTLTHEISDIPLNALGVEQAESIRPLLEGLPIHCICHSPLLRVKQTMEIATQNLSYEQVEVPDLKECSIGVWFKMTSCQNGQFTDSTKDFLEQVQRGISQTLRQEGTPLIIAHGGVHWALCHLLAIKEHDWHLGHCDLICFKPNSDQTWVAENVARR